MHLIVEPTPLAAAQRAAAAIANACQRAVTARGRACIAISGGETPWLMLEALAAMPLPWQQLCVTQVDERMTDLHDARRSLLRQRMLLQQHGPLPEANLLPLPVEALDDPESIDDWLHELALWAGAPPVFDLVHLGLGADGHTASLIPGDPLLDAHETDLGVSAAYQGLPRMTLTLPALRRAREILWLVTGASKGAALRALLDGNGDSPAVRLARPDATIIADSAAAGAAHATA